MIKRRPLLLILLHSTHPPTAPEGGDYTYLPNCQPRMNSEVGLSTSSARRAAASQVCRGLAALLPAVVGCAPSRRRHREHRTYIPQRTSPP
ncbi:hypothetical protein F4809DRAFT_607373 [Biscogniauxia mediterranea]|nr:hypothetical protein F4809DRAFT_607373 [Biscogniauxia mediterranea]